MLSRDKRARKPLARKLAYVIVIATVVIIVTSVYLLWHTRSATETSGETTERELNLVSSATIYCESVEYESDSIYMAGNCFIAASIVNMENETIEVRGISILYGGGSGRVDIPLNISIEAHEKADFTEDFILPARVLVYRDGQVHIGVIIHIRYSGGIYRFQVRMLNLDV